MRCNRCTYVAGVEVDVRFLLVFSDTASGLMQELRAFFVQLLEFENQCVRYRFHIGSRTNKAPYYALEKGLVFSVDSFTPRG